MNNILREAFEKSKRGDAREAVGSFLEEYYDVCLGLYTRDLEEPYPEELTIPLEERESGILEGIQWFVDNNYDLNEGDWPNPLQGAVQHADVYMTSFLIKNGADANDWPGKGEDLIYEDEIEDNWYLVDLDIACMDSHWPLDERYMDALVNTARVLLVEGKVGSFAGIVLEVDCEKRYISFGEGNYVYY